MGQQVGHEYVPEELYQLHDMQVWKQLQPAAMEIKKLIQKAEFGHLLERLVIWSRRGTRFTDVMNVGPPLHRQLPLRSISNGSIVNRQH